MIHAAVDPCDAIETSDLDLDAAYDAAKVAIVSELRSLVDGADRGPR